MMLGGEAAGAAKPVNSSAANRRTNRVSMNENGAPDICRDPVILYAGGYLEHELEGKIHATRTALGHDGIARRDVGCLGNLTQLASVQGVIRGCEEVGAIQ